MKCFYVTHEMKGEEIEEQQKKEGEGDIKSQEKQKEQKKIRTERMKENWRKTL